MRTCVLVALTLMLMPSPFTTDGGQFIAAAQTAAAADDSKVIETVLEAIRRSRNETSSIVVLDSARPVCRRKVTEHEMPWPFQCVEDPLRYLKASRKLPPEWLQSAGLSDADRAELVRSFEERNNGWHILPRIQTERTTLLARERWQEPYDGSRSLLVFSLPGYSGTQRAVVFATFNCGSLCGTEYLVVLERSIAGWKVISSVVGLGIS